MERKPFNQWVKEQRKKQQLSYEQCVERVNRRFETEYTASTWRQWEDRFYEDTPRDRARKIAEGLQVPEAQVFAAGGLIPDDQDAIDIPPQIALMYAALNPDRRYIADALIKILHEQQVQERVK